VKGNSSAVGPGILAGQPVVAKLEACPTLFWHVNCSNIASEELVDLTHGIQVLAYTQSSIPLT
jgi:hypothetical protein